MCNFSVGILIIKKEVVNNPVADINTAVTFLKELIH